MTAFITAFVLVAIAEMADKTQLLTLSLACRYPARKVLIGVGLAIAMLNVIAVVIGAVAGRFIPVSAVQIGAGVLFVAFGLWNLLAKDKPEEAEECEVRSDKHVVLAVTGAFLLAEIGDKTQLATLSLGARFEGSLLSSVGVWAGATVGMILANALAVIVGHVAGRRVPEKLMKRISGVLFVGFGIWTLVEAFL
jgi:putative Ca2+/H+ antiporter (TMEM165/GDT1 family)